MTNMIFLLSLSKHQFLNYFHPWPHVDPTHETNNNRKGFDIMSFGSIVCLYWYRFKEIMLKTSQVILPCPTIQGLAVDAMYTSKGEITVYVGYA